MIEYDRHLQDLTDAVRRGMDAGFDPLAKLDDCPYLPDDAARRCLWMDAYTKGRIALGLLTLTQKGASAAHTTLDAAARVETDGGWSGADLPVIC